MLSSVIGEGVAQRILLWCLVCSRTWAIWAQALIERLNGGRIRLKISSFYQLLRLHWQILETLRFILNQIAQFLIGKPIINHRWIFRLFGSDHLWDLLFLYLKDFALHDDILSCFGSLLFNTLILTNRGSALRWRLTSFFILNLI